MPQPGTSQSHVELSTIEPLRSQSILNMLKFVFSSPEPKALGELLWSVFVRRPSICP